MMSKPRSSKGFLLPPASNSNIPEAEREKWLSDAARNFITASPANRTYYEVLLRAFWPPGHGIPGPVLTADEIRSAVDTSRKANGNPPYKDVFRRLRELQGEEGYTSIIKEGTKYQLQSLETSEKRAPREKLSSSRWQDILQNTAHRCAHCGQQEPRVSLSPDHRRPRSRGGDNSDSNWQPLCEQCNIQKSSACQGCTLNCMACPWAYPETYKPIVLDDQNREQIRRGAEKAAQSPSAFANDILRSYFNSKK